MEVLLFKSDKASKYTNDVNVLVRIQTEEDEEVTGLQINGVLYEDLTLNEDLNEYSFSIPAINDVLTIGQKITLNLEKVFFDDDGTPSEEDVEFSTIYKVTEIDLGDIIEELNFITTDDDDDEDLITIFNKTISWINQRGGYRFPSFPRDSILEVAHPLSLNAIRTVVYEYAGYIVRRKELESQVQMREWLEQAENAFSDFIKNEDIDDEYLPDVSNVLIRPKKNSQDFFSRRR